MLNLNSSFLHRLLNSLSLSFEMGGVSGEGDGEGGGGVEPLAEAEVVLPLCQGPGPEVRLKGR